MSPKGSDQGRRAKRTASQRAAPERRQGRYEVLDLLGAGGMAEVFKARATGSAGFQRDVVLKRVHAARNGDPAIKTAIDPRLISRRGR